MSFQLKAPYRPAGDQPNAIETLEGGFRKGLKDQVLLGVTGSGKTFAIANLVERIQRPTLVIAHNKTLAAQLHKEFQTFFPDNAVHYFVSYYDYYQPEAYLPASDTYIEKDAKINREIERLRNAATQALLTRNDVLVIASVSAIYGLGNPTIYQNLSLELEVGDEIPRHTLFSRFLELRYARNEIAFFQSNFRVSGDTIDIFPTYSQTAFRLDFFGNRLEKIIEFEPIAGRIVNKDLVRLTIHPATHYLAPVGLLETVVKEIKADLKIRLKELKAGKKLLEVERLNQRTNYDLEMLQTTGIVNGIENYSRYFDRRKPGEPPATLLSYFPKDYLLVIDESHQTIPQIRGMYFGDRSRKESLVEHGFRLPSAFDNRPLKFPEFQARMPETIYTSATPGPFELTRIRDQKLTIIKSHSKIKGREVKNKPPKKELSALDRGSLSGLVEMIVRPTGLLDPKVEVRKTAGQIADLIEEITGRVARRERVLVTTLTKRMAEELTDHLAEKGLKVEYLHSDIETLSRIDILRQLRLGEFDILVGINLLREGLDLPEVSLVAIMDADKEGFLRSETALVQTYGRAARHKNGQIIMYADRVTGSMARAIEETERRRRIQAHYNLKHKIKPRSAKSPIPESGKSARLELEKNHLVLRSDLTALPPEEKSRLMATLKIEMELAARNLDFERAAVIRDKIDLLKQLGAKKR